MEHLNQKKKITIMIAIMAAMLFAGLNQTIVGTALPRIVAKLGGMDYYSWVFTVYMLTASITTIMVGKLSDMYGRKPFILLGIGIFIIGSFLCGTSNDIVQLIIYRGIQGFGGGMIMSTAFTAVADLFSPRERGRWQGLMGSVFGLSSVIGPILGGYIVDNADWHWVFWIFLPVGVIAFFMIWSMFPRVESKQTDPVDYFGSLFLALTLIPMLLAFSWAGTEYAWQSPEIIGLFTGSACALAIFLWAETNAKSPILPLSLFKNSVVTISNLVSFMIGVGMFGAIMYMPYFLQGVLGTSASASGFLSLPMTFGLIFSSSLSGQLIFKTGKYKKLAFVGLILCTLAMLSMSLMSPTTTIMMIILNMSLLGIGLGLTMPIFSLTVQNAVDHKELGVATASSQLFRSLGSTIGVSVMGTILSQLMAKKLLESSLEMGDSGSAGITPEMADPQVLLNPSELQAVQEALPVEMQEMFGQFLGMLKSALSFSLSGVFLAGTVVFCLAIVLTFFLKEIPLRTSNRSKSEKVLEESEKIEGESKPVLE